MNPSRSFGRVCGWLLLALLWAGATAGALCHTLLSNWRAPLVAASSPYRFEFARGASLASLVRELSAEGVVPYPRSLMLLARWRGDGARLQAGEYELGADMDAQALLDMLAQGRVVQHAFTIIEGWTVAELRRSLSTVTTLASTTVRMSDAELMSALGMPDVHPEGRFLPDTYFHPRHTADLDVLRRAARALAKALDRAWSTRAPDLPYRTPDELLALASIVEKETGVAAERTLIAGVFVRRLRAGMRLQTDPTVIYGLGAAFDGNLRRRDLEADSPYNTYTRAGLPPTPIALVGAAALEAAAHPADGTALYFVARGDGSHEFSASLEAHNRAVSRYQLGKTP